MQLTLEQIQDELIEGDITPHRISQFRAYLAARYSLEAGRLHPIQAIKPAIWLAARGRKDSDTATEREWEASEPGLRELELKSILKRIDRLSSALNAIMKIKEGEVRNQF